MGTQIGEKRKRVAFSVSRFRKALEKRRLSVYGLAKRVGIRQLSAVKKLAVAGPNRTCGAALRTRLASALNVPEEWLGGSAEYEETTYVMSLGPIEMGSTWLVDQRKKKPARVKSGRASRMAKRRSL